MNVITCITRCCDFRGSVACIKGHLEMWPVGIGDQTTDPVIHGVLCCVLKLIKSTQLVTVAVKRPVNILKRLKQGLLGV